MKVYFSGEALRQYQWFIKNNSKLAYRIASLVEAIESDYKRGIGKPEALRHKLTGFWSRRIDNKNRLIYRLIDNDTIEIVRCKGHYDEK